MLFRSIVSDKADLAKAVEGVARSAFGLTGQKCSALSRLYVHEAVKKEFTERLLARVAQIKIGDPTDQSVFMGPIINERAMKKFDQAVMDAGKEGKVLVGGTNLRSQSAYSQGWFVPATVVEISHNHRVAREEHFAPLLAIMGIKNFQEGITKANDSEYGLKIGRAHV